MKTKNIIINLLLLTILLGILSGCSAIGGSKYELTIGTTGESGVTEITDTFKLGEDVGLELEGNREFGTSSLSILFIEHDGDTESILGSYDEAIDPEWSWFYIPFTDVDAGEYTIKVLHDNGDVLGKGRFTVVE